MEKETPVFSRSKDGHYPDFVFRVGMDILKVANELETTSQFSDAINKACSTLIELIHTPQFLSDVENINEYVRKHAKEIYLQEIRQYLYDVAALSDALYNVCNKMSDRQSKFSDSDQVACNLIRREVGTLFTGEGMKFDFTSFDLMSYVTLLEGATCNIAERLPKAVEREKLDGIKFQQRRKVLIYVGLGLIGIGAIVASAALPPTLGPVIPLLAAIGDGTLGALVSEIIEDISRSEKEK